VCPGLFGPWGCGKSLPSNDDKMTMLSVRSSSRLLPLFSKRFLFTQSPVKSGHNKVREPVGKTSFIVLSLVLPQVVEN
jgi:hypothetical protein